MATIVIVNGIGDTVVAFRGTLVRELVARGHRVVVSTPKPIERAIDEVAAEIRAIGAEVEWSPLDRTGVNPFKERATRAHFRALFERLRPDAVLATNPKPVFHAISAARAAGDARRVAMVTGLGFAFTGNSLRARVLRFAATRLYRGAMRDATTVLFQNGDDEAELRSRGLLAQARDVRRIAGSGVDLAQFPRQPLPSGDDGSGGIVFLMVARLLGDKGVREFAEAARIVRAERADCRFRLVGWIDSNPAAIARAELDAWIADGAISYAGRLDDVRAELAACSVFVLPSYREGTPKSTLEALATGRAVITSDAPGCRETVIDGVNGLLVPPRDARALGDACLALAADPAQRAAMSAASRELAEKRFDARKVNATIIEALGA